MYQFEKCKKMQTEITVKEEISGFIFCYFL